MLKLFRSGKGVTPGWVVCAAALLAGVSSVEAQKALPEPTIPNVFYALPPAGGLVALEHQGQVTFRTKTKALPGYASSRVLAEMQPARSPVRLPATVQFVIRGRTPLDPVARYELRLLQRGKHARDFAVAASHGSLLGANGRSAMAEGAITLWVEDYGAASYRLRPAQPLAAGEYALAVRGALTDLYCFGVN